MCYNINDNPKRGSVNGHMDMGSFSEVKLMAPLPFNNTAVYAVTYSWSQGTGTMIFRYDDAATTLSQVITTVVNITDAMAPILDDQWRFIGARNQTKGASFSLPAVLPASPTTSPGAQLPENRPIQVTFVGRTTGGRRTALSFFGTRLIANETFRYLPGENTEIDATVLELQDSSQGILAASLVGIDGADIVWYNYANINYNSYYESKARR